MKVVTLAVLIGLTASCSNLRKEDFPKIEIDSPLEPCTIHIDYGEIYFKCNWRNK